jgi:hypothetical protein
MVNDGVNKPEVVRRLSQLTGHAIGPRLVITVKGKSRFADFFDITMNKYRRCTIKKSCIVSNIRELKIKHEDTEERPWG